MFSGQIVSSDEFLEMPLTSQALYFHLGMTADDDGFVSPRKVLRMCGAGEDDLKILLAKGFVIRFENGIIVITHWKQNNYLRNDRYTPTIYKAEASRLSCIQGVYALDTIGIPEVYHLDTQVGRKVGSKREDFENRNEDTLSPARRAEHHAKIRELLHKKLTDPNRKET
jgi:hypothetical protein